MQHPSTDQQGDATANSFTSFGALLLFLRRRARLRQRDLAVAVGYSEAQIGRLENDQRLPDVTTVMAQFVPALDLDDAPHLAERLIELAREARRTEDDGGPVVTGGEVAPLPPAPGAEVPALMPALVLDLPHQPTPFLGRVDERTTLAQLLQSATERCITVRGPGGIGKTRLALEVAREHTAHFVDGVYAVALASVPSADLLALTIARTLGLTGLRDSDAAEALHHHLRPKQLLLLLDNLEHLMDGAAFVAQLLAEAPNLHVLVTSRERLHIRGEVVVELAGLPLPPDGSTATPGNDSAAVDLFWATAQRVRPELVPALEQLRAAARICRLVDGLPLAIELAAAWVHMLSVDEIEQELGGSLDLLQSELRDLPSRHRSLRATYAYSWQLLTPPEQTALLRLSVFQGNFTRAAAHAVLAGSSSAQRRPTGEYVTLQLLGALANKSMLQTSGEADGSRYGLHPLVRQYAADDLAAQPDELHTAAHNHSHYYLDFLRSYEADMRGPTQHQAIARLAAEEDNLRAAVQWIIAEGDVASLRRFLPSLVIFFEQRYATQEGLRVCLQISERLRAAVPPGDERERRAVQALAAAYAGWFCFYLGHPEALAHLREAHVLAMDSDDWLVRGDTLRFEGIVVADAGDVVESQRLLLGAIHAYEASGDPWLMSRTYHRLATVLHQNGAYVIAQQLFAVCLQYFRTIGDPRGIGLTLNRIGVIDALLGRYAQAQLALQEGLEHCSAVNDRRGMATALFHMGSVAQQRDDHAGARYFYGESKDIFAELNQPYTVADVLAQIGYSAVLMNDLPAATTTLHEAWQLVRGADITTTTLAILIGRAALDLATEQCERAVEALTLAVNHPGCEQDTRNRAHKLLRRAEELLLPYSFVAAQARGRTAAIEAFLT